MARPRAGDARGLRRRVACNRARKWATPPRGSGRRFPAEVRRRRLLRRAERGASGLADVELFIDDGYVPDPGLAGRQRVHHFSAFERRDRQQPFDAVMYQMGGTFMQEFMHDAIRRRPGLVVLHDLLMGLGLFAIYRHRGKLDEFRTRLITPEGPDALSRYDAIMQSARLGTGSSAESRSCSRSTTCLAGSWTQPCADRPYGIGCGGDRHTVRARAPVGRRHGGPGSSEPRFAGAVAMLRWKYGIPRSAFVVGVFGSVVPVKRLEVCVQAVARVRERRVDCRLVSVGEPQDRAYAARLDEFVEGNGLRNAVTFVGHRREALRRTAHCRGLVLNLRYPSLKGMSAILVRSLAAGKPTVISDVAEWRTCRRRAAGASPPTMPKSRISPIASSRSQQTRASTRRPPPRRGRSSSVERHCAHMAAQYLEVVEEMLARSAVACPCGGRIVSVSTRYATSRISRSRVAIRDRGDLSRDRAACK